MGAFWKLILPLRLWTENTQGGVDKTPLKDFFLNEIRYLLYNVTKGRIHMKSFAYQTVRRTV